MPLEVPSNTGTTMENDGPDAGGGANRYGSTFSTQYW